MMKKSLRDELLSKDSSVSSMRWAFMLTIKSVLWFIGLSISGAIILPFFGHTIDLIGVTALLSPIVAFAFSAKAGQSFSENSSPKDTTNPPPKL
jgi:hypothetical protein